jgi:predicted transcriptional regulator
MKGLISKSPHIENILAGKKTWEIRGCNTKIRGEIALIKSGSGTVVGKCELVGVIEQLTIADLEQNIDKHCVPLQDFDKVFGGYKKIYAWVLADARKLEGPIAYQHPQGAIIWVNLINIKI